VFLLGLNEELTPHGAEAGDVQLETLRRLLAMAIGRARESVVLCCKKEDASSLIAYLDTKTYEVVRV